VLDRGGKLELPEQHGLAPIDEDSFPWQDALQE
jgi:hypothetical protein